MFYLSVQKTLFCLPICERGYSQKELGRFWLKSPEDRSWPNSGNDFSHNFLKQSKAFVSFFCLSLISSFLLDTQTDTNHGLRHDILVIFVKISKVVFSWKKFVGITAFQFCAMAVLFLLWRLELSHRLCFCWNTIDHLKYR